MNERTTIGIDFDNTLVSYDALFHRVAVDQGVIPADTPINKNAVRDCLRRLGKEDVWTQMQGEVYGGRMSEALAFANAIETVRRWIIAGFEVYIVSHKTRHPYLGHPYDLHESARGWLSQHGFFEPSGVGMHAENVFFELTREAKIERIQSCNCHWFIDDLPEVLAHDQFPTQVKAVLFDPQQQHSATSRWVSAVSWNALDTLIRSES